jgi:hypothetical protein
MVERIDTRNLPPVPQIDGWPARYSQTLLGKADRCLRSAYLYVLYHGGAPGHQLNRGSAAHAVFQRIIETLVEADERSLFALQEGEDESKAASEVASFTAAIVDEVLRERPDLHIPVGEADAVRVMAYHVGVALKLELEKVVGVERKFVMDIAGREVSGIVDFAQIDGNTAEVWDWKTSWNRPEQDDYEKSFQPRLYALLLAFGQPVEKALCPSCEARDPERSGCDTCDGTGVAEVRLPPIGEHLHWIRTREIYPRYLNEDGTLQERANVLSRTDLHDFRSDLERLIAQLDQAHETGGFPAVSGHHCDICPAPSECPLPKHLREWAGAIETPEQAAEAAEWADHWNERVQKVNAELRRWAGENGGRIRYGTDLLREFVASQSRGVRRRGKKTDWEGFETAIKRAADGLEELDLDHWVKTSQSNSFKKRVLSAEELAAESSETGGSHDEKSLDDRFGPEPPW